MRIVVTGAGGFVGRKFVRTLAPNHDVVGIDLHCPALPGVQAIQGDIADPAVLAKAFGDGCDAVVHLATVPGGAAEADPVPAFRANVDATAALVEQARACGPVRFVLASSIAVLGDPLPATVDDETPLRPRMLYGAHKAMGEQWLGTMSRRGALEGLSVRLPGIVARPLGPSGMKSAFMSDIFHAGRRGDRFVAPVSGQATLWLMSRDRIVANLIHALNLPFAHVPEPFALTLPSVRTSFSALAAEIARQTGADPAFVRHEPDAALEAGFGRQPPVATPMAERLGFTSDISLERLTASALEGIAEMEKIG